MTTRRVPRGSQFLLVAFACFASGLVVADGRGTEAAEVPASTSSFPTQPPDPDPRDINFWSWTPTFDAPPVVSPDGSKIAWSEFDGVTYQIAVANSDGSDRVLISDRGAGPAPVENTDPAWSPDGRSLAWSGADEIGDDGLRGIFTADVDGANRKQIASADGDSFGPVWSPDGSQIAWWTAYEILVSCSCTLNRVFVANADGTERITLSDHPNLDEYTNHRFPVWRDDGERIYWAADIFFAVGVAPYLVSMTSNGSYVCLYGDDSPLPCLRDVQEPADSTSLAAAERLSLRFSATGESGEALLEGQ